MFKRFTAVWLLVAVGIAVAQTTGIDYPHKKIHTGDAFAYYIDTTLGNAGVFSVFFYSRRSEQHLIFEVNSSGAAIVKMFENSTTSDSGTAVTPVNRNRSKASRVSNLILNKNDTGTGDSLLLYASTIGASQKEVGMTRDVQEWILKPYTRYRIKVTSEAADNRITLGMSWYQDED